MARHVELGLNRFGQPEMADIPEQTQERPDFGKIGTERVMRAKEAIKSGLFGILKRVAAAPDMAKYYSGVANEKVGDLHEGAGNLRDSVVDKIGEKIIIPLGERTVEPVKKGAEWTAEQTKAAYHATVETGQKAYKGLETRAVNSYNFLEAAARRAKESWDRKSQEREFAAAKKNLNEAFEKYNTIARATGRRELVSRPAQL